MVERRRCDHFCVERGVAREKAEHEAEVAVGVGHERGDAEELGAEHGFGREERGAVAVGGVCSCHSAESAFPHSS